MSFASKSSNDDTICCKKKKEKKKNRMHLLIVNAILPVNEISSDFMEKFTPQKLIITIEDSKYYYLDTSLTQQAHNKHVPIK